MVDKITKRKLKSFFVYDAWKVVLVSTIFCVIFVLLFNFISKKPTDGQDFKIMLDDDIVMTKAIDDYIEALFTTKPTEGGFSYEMLKGETMYMRGTEENPEEYLLGGVYCDLNYDDVCILGEKLYLAYLKMQGGAVDINEYIKDAKNYLFSNEFCDNNGVFNESKVFEYFDKTRKGDSRFRTKEQKEKGRLDELERLKGIYFMAESLQSCFIEHPYLLDEQREGTDKFGQKVMGSYALKLGELDGGDLGDISSVFSIVKEDGNNADGVYLAIGNNKEENGDLYYEMLAVLYQTIKNYSTYL
ncbi:MAG: hypothetical protein E7358_05320 [Clostridiales bacterium]|nr:hypothetical protein [Clostridiales bacterium]